MINSTIGSTGIARDRSETASRKLFDNLTAGLRLAFFMRVCPDSFRWDVNQAVFLALAIATTLLLSEYLMVLPTPEFNAAGIGTIAAGYAGLLLGVWVITALARDSRLFLPLAVVLTSVQPALIAVTSVATLIISANLKGYDWLIASWSVFGAVVIWHIVIGLRTVRLLVPQRGLRSLIMAGIYLAAILGPVFAIPQVPVWYEGLGHEDIASAPPPEPIDVERTYYAQPALLENSLSGVEPTRPGVVDLYFVGFAGYGAQDAFMNEVRLAARLFGKRFDTSGRSLTLINNRQTTHDLPLANNSNLRLALKGLAERMNSDEDIMFLFLTSHGSRNRLSTGFWPLQHNDLQAAELRTMLDEAGIGWRVIVVSACYSGSFIDELRSNRTLVITASREDRNSFGCSDDAEMTYFGRALIDKALRSTYSFVNAYEQAAKQISLQEEAEGLTPSEPQISVGAEISSKLTELEDRLERLGDLAARQ